MKKTVVIGASENKERYSYKATVALNKHHHEVIPIGLKEGEIEGIKISKEKLPLMDIDTVTMYVGPGNQQHWYDYILSLKPKRVIFNPGAENPEFGKVLKEKNIEVEDACTLVLLSTGQY